MEPIVKRIHCDGFYRLNKKNKKSNKITVSLNISNFFQKVKKNATESEQPDISFKGLSVVWHCFLFILEL